MSKEANLTWRGPDGREWEVAINPTPKFYDHLHLHLIGPDGKIHWSMLCPTACRKILKEARQQMAIRQTEVA